jgi:hypothetical protein
MKSLESIYNSILLENQNPNIIDIELLKECVDGIYTINDDGSIDVDGSVYLNGKNLTKIPFKFRNFPFKFRNVSRCFDCSNNQLTSLEGAPNNVGDAFWCNYNQLTSLEGAPSSVGVNFSCGHNQLISLDGAPSSVGGYFNCYGNPSLPYSELSKIVDRVKGNIYYSNNTAEDKDKIRRDRDIKGILKSDELGSLDV